MRASQSPGFAYTRRSERLRQRQKRAATMLATPAELLSTIRTKRKSEGRECKGNQLLKYVAIASSTTVLPRLEDAVLDLIHSYFSD